MQMLRVWLLAACAVAFGCSERSNQVLTGHVDTDQSLRFRAFKPQMEER